MAKFAVLATIFAVLLLVGNTYAHRTITVEIDEEANRRTSRDSCQQQIQQRDLSQCERYITQSRGRNIEMVVRDGANPQQRSQSLQQCCSQMRQLDDECHCRALEQIVEEGQQQGQRQQGQQQRQMVDRAQTVVTYCRLPQRCDFQSAW
ncbi:hypothetical protein ACOSQ2_030820 [Xanthoceras sorbifolium]